jgi:hypothetical protein
MDEINIIFNFPPNPALQLTWLRFGVYASMLFGEPVYNVSLILPSRQAAEAQAVGRSKLYFSSFKGYK